MLFFYSIIDLGIGGWIIMLLVIRYKLLNIRYNFKIKIFYLF